ncbi:DUF2892 domain-containing protein (plasmid) [Pseudorhodobacter turbinis]|uniref:DUF2892 domain-containing protein n=1 Tax=Pseudorhodobacter turbinis TaxID=2500533 RepID=A0A4P8EII2_9RHOB|nr:DUF2892 domain-containing protein [Pseudorhodobacter turbinis]QCO56786.1 DUF2892 domain-containing protein [Pseudorhodobacter turbinis]
MFKTNVGGADRVLRIVLGIALIAAFFALPNLGWRWVLAVVGAVALFTGLSRSCLLYSLIGINTCSIKK